jgi:hypothetical protein
MTDGQLASLPWCRAPIWSPWPDFFFSVWQLQVSCGGYPLWREDGSVIYLYNCFWALPEQSLWGPSPAELRQYFTVSFETHSTWSARSLYLYHPGTGWPSYTPGHWDPFSLPLTIPRAMGLKFKLYCDWRSVGQFVFLSDPHLGPVTRFLLLSDICGFHVMGRHPWREDRSVIYSYNLLSLLGPSPAELMTIFCCLIWDSTQPGGPGPRIYIRQEQGDPVIPVIHFKSKSKSCYDWWSVIQYVLVSSPLWNLWPDIKLLCCLCGVPSLMRGRVCLLSVTVSNSLSILKI